MKTHNVEQGTQEWLDLRASHFTASEAAAMMGASKYQSRQSLLEVKSTGIREEITPSQQFIFDKGHAAEAAARPIIEKLIGEELYPVVATKGELLASFDGLTMDDAVVFEHKLWNENLARRVISDVDQGSGLEPHYIWQLEQQLYISGADKVIFVCSDGTDQNMVYCWYYSNTEKREALLSGWEQFKKDLAEYNPVEHKPEAKGVSVLELPALIVQIAGEVKNSNLPAFRDTALARIESVKTDLQTDQDFADAEANVKFFSKAEKELEAAKKQAMAQTIDIDQLFRTVDQLKETMRSKRLELDKLVKARKVAIKQEIIADAQNALSHHINELRADVVTYLPPCTVDFAGAIKGKKTVKSIREAVADTMALAKIDVTGHEKRITKNIDILRVEADGYGFLLSDKFELVQMDSEHLRLIIKNRISEHKAAEAARLEAERERIRQEEERKAKAEAARLAEQERIRIRQEEAAKAQESARIEREEVELLMKEQARLERKQEELQKLQQQADADFSNRFDEELVNPDIVYKSMSQAVNDKEGTVTIPVSEYEDLKQSAFKLQCLEDAGVDNWSGGYDCAMKAFHNEYPIR